jgi:hypothetical protein
MQFSNLEWEVSSGKMIGEWEARDGVEKWTWDTCPGEGREEEAVNADREKENKDGEGGLR